MHMAKQNKPNYETFFSEKIIFNSAKKYSFGVSFWRKALFQQQY